MRVRRVRVFKFDVPLKEPFRIATMVTRHAENVLVSIETDAGLVGWGEGSPLRSIVGETQATCLAACRALGDWLVGQDPLAIGHLSREMERFLPHNSTAACALDMALHDIAAKAAGMPLYAYLGGLNRPMETAVTIPLLPPEEVGKQAEAIIDADFDIVKIKLGGSTEDDVARVEAVRDAIGPSFRLRVDANQGWHRIQAATVLQNIEELDVEFCEQPLVAHDYEGMKWLGTQTGIPIMADESLFGPESALRLAEMQAAPFFNIKLSKSRGMHFGKQIAGVAEAAGIRCMVGAMVESPIGLAGIAHFGTASPCFDFWDLDTTVGQSVNPALGGVRIEEGRVILPEGPGLGVEPEPRFLAGCPEA